MPCLGENTISALLGGALDEPRLRGAEAHLDGCVACRALLRITALSATRDERLAPARPTLPLAPGSWVDGRYRIEGLLGSGGMGRVYRASEPSLRREVALKVPAGDAAWAAGGLRERFLHEARLMARVAHHNVVTVYGFGQLPEQASVYLAMELVEGETARALFTRTRAPAQLLPLFVQAAEGLAAAHRAGLVHRDLKPENLLLGPGGRACVADFGIARLPAEEATALLAEAGAPAPAGRLTLQGLVVGSPGYMAPEQMAGGPVDARSDLFSLCVVVHEGLTGRRPFAGESLSQLQQQISAGPTSALELRALVPAALAEALCSGLSPRPAERPRLSELGALLRSGH